MAHPACTLAHHLSDGPTRWPHIGLAGPLASEVGEEPASFPRRRFSPNCHLFAHHLQLVLPPLMSPEGMSACTVMMAFPHDASLPFLPPSSQH